jgi:hypothetical protein
VTQTPSSEIGGTTVSYGFVLVNRSKDEDAVDVQVGINLVDASNRVVTSTSDFIDAIPAGVTYYDGGSSTTDDLRQIVRLETFIDISRSVPRAIQLPVVSDVRVIERTTTVSDVVGEVKNETPKTLDSLASVTTVLFDAAGNVIGGGQGFLSFALPPGGREAFSVSAFVPVGAIASAKVSAEPDYE